MNKILDLDACDSVCKAGRARHRLALNGISSKVLQTIDERLVIVMPGNALRMLELAEWAETVPVNSDAGRRALCSNWCASNGDNATISKIITHSFGDQQTTTTLRWHSFC